MADSKDTDVAVLPELRVSDKAPESLTYSDADGNEKRKLSPGPEALTGHYDPHDGLGDTLYVKGEPVIKDGKDVSRFAVDLRDDGDPPLTFRSFVLGSVFGALGAALYQACSPARILHLNIQIYFQIDLHVQTNVYRYQRRFSAADYLVIRSRMGKDHPTRLDSTRHQLRRSCSYPRLPQSWGI
jgi:hypothetical protein